MLGTVGGRYKLIHEIGSGSTGRVYLALDMQTGRSVAAKVMRAGSGRGEDLESLLRFYQEGAVLSTLSHPNIVAVHGAIIENNSCSIIMEFIEGQPLSALMRDEAITLERARNL